MPKIVAPEKKHLEYVESNDPRGFLEAVKGPANTGFWPPYVFQMHRDIEVRRECLKKFAATNQIISDEEQFQEWLKMFERLWQIESVKSVLGKWCIALDVLQCMMLSIRLEVHAVKLIELAISLLRPDILKHNQKIISNLSESKANQLVKMTIGLMNKRQPKEQSWFDAVPDAALFIQALLGSLGDGTTEYASFDDAERGLKIILKESSRDYRFLASVKELAVMHRNGTYAPAQSLIDADPFTKAKNQAVIDFTLKALANAEKNARREAMKRK